MMNKLFTVNKWYYNEIPVTEYKIKAKVGKALTFAFVSDIHEYPWQPIISSIERYCGKNAVDAVLVGGDYFHNGAQYENGLEFLRRSAEKYPTICSTGNHEISRTPDYRRLVGQAGAVLLENSHTVFEGVNIGGVRGLHRPDKKWLREFSSLEGCKLLLSHHPEFYRRYISRLPVDLVLSGHAHGGQWRLCGRGLFAPGQGVFPKYTGGMYHNRLIVSRGIGNLAPVPRVNNPPEIVAVILCREE